MWLLFFEIIPFLISLALEERALIMMGVVLEVCLSVAMVL